jgi:GT2 family glycosyltransferase
MEKTQQVAAVRETGRDAQLEGHDGRPGSLAIVIVTWNNRDDIVRCLRSLGSVPREWRVWVFDNASQDGTPDVVRNQFPEVTVTASDENVGFARANNEVIAQTSSEYVLLLNPDTVVSRGAIEAALDELRSRPDVGILTVRLHNPDGSLQPSCFRFHTPWMNLVQFSGIYRFLPHRWRARHLLAGCWDHNEARPVDWTLGAFMLARRRVIEQVGPLPEEYFLFTEDMEWCYRMQKAGYSVWFTPAASIVHHGNQSAGQMPSAWRAKHTHRGKYAFVRRHFGPLAMRLVQWTDIVGYTLRRWMYSRLCGRAASSDRTVHQKMILGQQAAWRELCREY